MNDPELYVSTGPQHLPYIRTLLETLWEHYTWGKCEKIIDLGSGAGNITVDVLLQKLPKDATLTGVDVSQEMVEFSSRCFSHERVNYRIQDFQKDLDSSSWQPRSFDKIFSFYCLHQLNDYKKAAENLHYLLKTGGYLTVHMPTRHPFVEAFETVMKDPTYKPFIWDLEMNYQKLYHSLDPLEIFCAPLRDAGFKVVFTAHEESKIPYTSIDDIVNLFESIGQFIKGVPKDMMEDYRKRVKEVFTKSKNIEILPSGEARLISKNIIIIATA